MAASEAFGILLVDKPVGPTSHDVVHQVRKATGIKKVGHTGTLDPMASGLLVLCLGQATRLSEYLTKQDKGYRARLRFGIETDTHDAQGEVLQEGGPIPPESAVRAALSSFRGEIEQVPPAHSAIRIKGKRAYEKARAGERIELPARQVEIYELKLVDFQPPEADLSLRCSSGTYVRALARDLGRILDTAAHLTRLRRTAVGSFSVDQAPDLDELLQAIGQGDWLEYFLPAAQALPAWPAVHLEDDDLEKIRHGRPVDNKMGEAGLARALTQQGELAAVVEAQDRSSPWQPRKVFIS